MDAPCLAFVCPLRWSDLSGDGAARTCGRCFREVHDLSALGPGAAAALLRGARTEPVCVRFRHVAGQLVFAAALAGPAHADDTAAPDDPTTWETETRPGEGRIAAPRDNQDMVMGVLDKHVIHDAIQAELPRIRKAVDKAARRGNRPVGRVTARIVFDRTGAASSVELKRSDLDHPDFEAKLLEILREVAVPPPKGGGIVIVSYPFVFAEPDDDGESDKPSSTER